MKDEKEEECGGRGGGGCAGRFVDRLTSLRRGLLRLQVDRGKGPPGGAFPTINVYEERTFEKRCLRLGDDLVRHDCPYS